MSIRSDRSGDRWGGSPCRCRPTFERTDVLVVNGMWRDPMAGRSHTGNVMPRKYGEKASAKVQKVMRERKRGTLRSGSSGKKVTSRKQAIAIGLSEARRAGAKVPSKRTTAREKT